MCFMVNNYKHAQNPRLWPPTCLQADPVLKYYLSDKNIFANVVIPFCRCGDLKHVDWVFGYNNVLTL